MIVAVNACITDPNAEYSIEHRVVHPDGTPRVVHERGKVYRNELQQPIRMIGTVHDITERGGSGLGMHIVYNLVTQTLGSQIRCISGPGHGARFEIPLNAKLFRKSDEGGLNAA